MARSIPKTLVAGFSLLVVGLALRWCSRPAVAPPMPIVRIGQAVGPLRVSPGPQGAFFTLPDGSLWHWGRVRSPDSRTLVPEQLGTNYDWTAASGGFSGMVAVKTNGTLWRSWYQDGSGALIRDLHPLGEDTDWATATRNGLATAALKRDGTLHTWGASVAYDGVNHGTLGDPQVQVRQQPGQVGTNLWRSLASDFSGYGFAGITRDGQLLVWGKPFYSGPTFPEPTPLAPDSRWLAASSSLYLDATSNLWFRPNLPRSPNGPILDIPFHRLRTNAAPGRYGMSLTELLEIRADGTLWRGPMPTVRLTSSNNVQVTLAPSSPWGDRRDWRQLWFGGGTVYGLTADGMLWVVGTDHGREAQPTLTQRMEHYTDELRRWVGLGPRGPGIMETTIPMIPEFRPLLRVVMPDGLALQVEPPR